MKQLLLAFLLLGLVTLLFPGLRQRMQPRIEESREWLGQKLEGPMAPVLNPYRTLKTESRMGEATRLLVRDRNRGQDPPMPDAFGQYLRVHQVEPVDGWGAPILLNQERDSVALRSAGPDLEYETEDDIVAKIRYAAPKSRFMRRR